MSAVKNSPAIGRPQRLHHNAWVTADQETTRQFYEEIVGLALVATWTESGQFGSEGEQNFCHTFYGLADGGALAFFQFADPDFARRHVGPAPSSPFHHVALMVDGPTQDAIRRRAAAASLQTTTTEHGYCTSLYVTDPNGLRLEFTVDQPDLKETEAARAERAHHDLQRWLRGDRRTNNHWRPARDGVKP